MHVAVSVAMKDVANVVLNALGFDVIVDGVVNVVAN